MRLCIGACGYEWLSGCALTVASHPCTRKALLPTHTQSLTHSLIHSLIHPLTHSFTHSSIHSLTHPLTPSFTHSLNHLPTHSRTHSSTHALTHSLTHSLTNPSAMARVRCTRSRPQVPPLQTPQNGRHPLWTHRGRVIVTDTITTTTITSTIATTTTSHAPKHKR